MPKPKDKEKLKSKIDDLNTTAWNIHINDSTKALAISKKALALARKADYKKGIADALTIEGFGLIRTSEFSKAQNCLLNAQEIYKSLDDLKGLAIVFEYLGIIERYHSKYAAALTAIFKALEFSRQTDFTENEITNLYQAGVTYRQLAEYEKALEYLFKSLSLCKKTGATLMEGYNLNVIGSVYFETGDYKQALHYYKKGLPLRKKSGDKWGEAGSLDSIGYCYLRLKDYKKAIEFCKKSLLITMRTGDKNGEANTLFHLGEAYNMAGDEKKALEYCNKSLAIRKRSGDKRGEAELLLLFADIYSKSKSSHVDDKIEFLLAEALKIARYIKANDLQSRISHNLYLYYNKAGNHKKAIVFLEKHFSLEKKIHKDTVKQKMANLEITRKAEEVRMKAEKEKQRNKELKALNEKIEKANKELKEAKEILEDRNFELQVEAALERVRTRAMSMQHSNELADLVSTLFKELTNLDFELTSCIIWIHDHRNTDNLWIASSEINKPVRPYHLQPFYHTFFRSIIHAWKEKDEAWAFTLVGEEKESFQHAFLKSIPDLPEAFRKALVNPEKIVFCASFNNFGALEVIGTEPLSVEKFEILHRFGKVFDLSYTRFNDLKKAEEQAKEAQIETALERVRGRAMAMHKSEELAEIVKLLYKQFEELDFGLYQILISIIDLKKNIIEWWSRAFIETDLPQRNLIPIIDHPFPNKQIQAWLNGDTYHTHILDGEIKRSWDEYLFTQSDLKNFPQVIKDQMQGIDRVFLTDAFMKYGVLQAAGPIPLPQSKTEILIRFAKVLDQAYTRMMDLQNAESQAREAQIEAALERVRSQTMAMQKSEDMGKTAAEMFKQIQTLGMHPWACGFNIFDEDEKAVTQYMSLADGGMSPPFRTPLTEDPFFINIYDARQRKEELLVWESKGESLAETYRYMFGLPGSKEIFGDLENSGFKMPKFQITHCAYFSQGYLVFITYESVPEAHDIFKRFAKVFEQTYTRFLDLQLKEDQSVKLKQEKERLEHTLMELQSTQRQLIQAEKMASLGELTAGIAHEIQNPLNFVNNFSEVSNELIDEMKVEMVNGNTDEAIAIAEDIKQNLQKINHHGKRADGIVKGMLQHSRSSSGVKEQTDINALADEYLRLAYHGLKAKDKSFNAKFETDFDNNVGMLEIVPQEIGRVILNLINNAFYAVSEKRKMNLAGYEPIVTVSTRRIENAIEIRVIDNGTGIPQKVLDKIFQPFFTTKPTGQGTGLGLSMSYDIITKGHDGELRVKTQDGFGSEFIIMIPA